MSYGALAFDGKVVRYKRQFADRLPKKGLFQARVLSPFDVHANLHRLNFSRVDAAIVAAPLWQLEEVASGEETNA